MKPKKILRSFPPSGIALISLTLSVVPAQAATVTKLDTTTLANGASDWSAAPGTGDTASYSTGSVITLANSVNQTLGGSLSINNLITSQSGKPPILIKADSNTLTLNVNNAPGDVNGANCAIVQDGTNTDLTMINCPISLVGNAIFRVSRGGLLAINGAIGDGGGGKSLTITAATNNGQPGTTLLSAANSYSGGTFIGLNSASSTLVALSGSATLGASGSALTMPTAATTGIILDLGGTSQTLGAVAFGQNCTVQNGSISGTSFSGSGLITANLSGTGLYTQNTNGRTLVLSGNNSYNGGTTITLGTLMATKPAALPLSGTISLAGSTSARLAIRAGGAGEWGASDLTNLLTYGSLTVGNNGALVIDTTGGNFSYGSAIDGPSPANLALTKEGPNTLTLSGASTYQKVTTINRGTLTVDNTAGGSLNSNSPLTFAGSGTFNYSTASTAQSLGALTLSSGDGNVHLNRTSDTTLTFASLAARPAGATANLSLSAGTPSATNGIKLTGVTPDALINQGLFFNGADYAYQDVSGSFVRPPVYGADTGFEAADTITASTHAKLTSTPAAQNNITLNTLNLSGSGVGFSLNGGQTLTLANGGIIKAGGGSAGTISDGNVQATDGIRDLVIRTNTSSDALTASAALGAYAPSRTATLTAGTKIITDLATTSDLYVGMAVLVNAGPLGNPNFAFGNNVPWTTITSIDSANQITVNTNVGTGWGGARTLNFGGNSLTKSGAGTLTLSGANTAVNVNLNGGQLNINHVAALGLAVDPTIVTSGNYGAIGTLSINEGTTIDNTSGSSITTRRYSQAWNGSFTFVGTDDLWLSTGGSLAIPNDLTVTTSTLGKTLKCGSGLSQTMARLTKRGPGTLQFDANGAQGLMGGLNVYEGVYATSLTNAFWQSVSASPIFLGDPAAANSLNAIIAISRGGAHNAPITAQAGSSGTLAILGENSPTFQGPLVLNNNLTLAAPSGTFNYLGVISGAGDLNTGVPGGGLSSITVLGVSKNLSNAGTVKLNNQNTFTGKTVINSGTLALGPLALINNSAKISIAAGTTFDVSQQTSPYTLSASNTLSASGTGTTAGTTAARIIGPSAGVVSFAARPITLTWAGDTSGTDTDSPSLHVSQGELTLNNNAVTINGATLDIGTYRLIQVGNGTSGTLNENGTPSYSVSGTAIDGGKTNVISSDGSGNLILTVTAGGGSPYDTWKAANAPGSNPDDDTDGDGVTNAVEFVLGGTSATGDLGKLPVAATSGTDMTFTFTRDETSVHASTVVTIEVSNDLVTWTAGSSPYAVPDADTAGPVNPGVTVVDNGATHTVTLTIPKAPDTKKFARLNVVITP